MPIRVSPNEPNPTHHVALRDRAGKEIGLILCNEKGEAFKGVSSFLKSPVETTAQKQTSGSSSYADFDYPYSPIVQDDFSGGRGSVDFERDSTKYYDSFRCRSGRANKAFLGPQEQYATGIRNLLQDMPGSVTWHQLSGDARHIYKRFTSDTTFTAGLIWILARRRGAPGDLTLAIHSDSAGSVGAELDSVTVPYTRMEDVLSEWLCETISQALASATAYWLVLYASADDGTDNHWLIGVNADSGSTYTSGSFSSSPTAADMDLYYRLTETNVARECIPFQYKEAQYFIINPTSGAPSLYLAGDRGVADSNSGQLSKLIDATKAWVTDEHVGSIVKIIDGPGQKEPQPWRVVTSNDATSLTVNEDWTIEHTTATEYIILGGKLREITGHGLSNPVTDVLVSFKHVIYFCMGEDVTVRRAKYERSGANWVATYANEATATKANFMVYMPKEDKIVMASNEDSGGSVSVAVMSGSIPAWGTDLTWNTPKDVDSKYKRITGLVVYPDEGGNEAVWIFKEDSIYTIRPTTAVQPISLLEMKQVQSRNNGTRPMQHNVYLYFPLQYGLERYYGGQFDDIGPNLGEGLPSRRRGNIVSMLGYPGKFFAAIDAGDAGYSSVLDSDGWHERYRAPLGQKIKAMAYQAIPGALSRLWIYQGNDLIWLPFPSDSASELEDATYPYTHEFAVVFSRMHAGMFDVQKLVKKIKVQSESLEVQTGTTATVCWFEMDYRLNDDDDWTPFDDRFTQSPNQEIDLTAQYGLAGKRLQLRIRGYTADNSKTPILLAIIVNAVIRTDVKYMYPLTFRLMDHEPLLSAQEVDATPAMDRLKVLEDWADASTDSMLKLSSISPLYDGKMIFLNPPTTRQIRFNNDPDNDFQRDVYLCNLTIQEA